MNEEEIVNWKDISCILEVDLEYPTSSHDLHNDYPLVLETMKLDKVDKLIPNLNDKKYILHYENLKLYESLELKITKIHNGIKFEESCWLKKYIDLNTQLRTNAANDFEKDLFKLISNSAEDYKNCLFSRENQLRKMNVFRSHHHDVYTEEINKVALSAVDDKRVIMDDDVHRLAYGHYSLRPKVDE